MSSLFHFTKIQNGFEILSSMKMRFNKFIYTNDPWENQMQLFSICALSSNRYGKYELYKFFENIELYNELNNNVKQILNKYQIVCFSKSFYYHNKIIYGYNQPRMWSHYSDNHKGFCFEFNESRLVKNLNNLFSNHFFKYEKVNYDNNFSRLENPVELNIPIEEFVNKHYKSLFFKKNINWRDEHEYRFLIKNNDLVEFSLKECLNAIYIGAEFNNAYLPLLEFYEKELEIPIYRMIPFELNLEKEYFNNFSVV